MTCRTQACVAVAVVVAELAQPTSAASEVVWFPLARPTSAPTEVYSLPEECLAWTDWDGKDLDTAVYILRKFNEALQWVWPLNVTACVERNKG